MPIWFEYTVILNSSKDRWATFVYIVESYDTNLFQDYDNCLLVGNGNGTFKHIYFNLMNATEFT